MKYEIGDIIIIRYDDLNFVLKCTILDDWGDCFILGEFKNESDNGEFVDDELYESLKVDIYIEKTQLPMVADNLTKGFKRRETVMKLNRPKEIKFPKSFL